MLDQLSVPTVSLGYGMQEMNIPLEYATAVCDLSAVLGARGAGVLTARGDLGVGTDMEDSFR